MKVSRLESITFNEAAADEYEWVDLGLPSGTLWATCNVGASSPEEYGGYFAWGETETKDIYDWTTYFDYDTEDASNRYKKYNTDGGLTTLLPEDDAATDNWSSDWEMPSLAQFEELINPNYTTTEWTELNGVQGRMITGKKNGESIFLPAAGFHNASSTNSVGSEGYYWSRSLRAGSSNTAEDIIFSSGSIGTLYSSRSLGFSVRPVRKQHEYVDLGLPSGTLWATMNVGANSPEEQGDGFRWGETEPYDGSGDATYKFYGDYYFSEELDDYVGHLTKYCSNADCGYEGYVDNLTELEAEDDAATVNWGSEWQMPSASQVKELLNSAYTTISFTTQNGTGGVLITSKTNNSSIFLPAQEDYWTREKKEFNTEFNTFDFDNLAYFLRINYVTDPNYQKVFLSDINLHYANSVRPVRKQ
ncbi:MAG: hypothetical protein IJS63_03790 [Bacteroidaceae bacterium]|nr:hypothetical protein [Bacteroidaceae bacterium]